MYQDKKHYQCEYYEPFYSDINGDIIHYGLCRCEEEKCQEFIDLNGTNGLYIDGLDPACRFFKENKDKSRVEYIKGRS